MATTRKTTRTLLPVPIESIERKIYLTRGHKVMLDTDLAGLYHVETKNLNKAVRRNLDRFPGDFMFQLTTEEAEDLRFQTGTSRWGGRRYFPYVFTEHGVAMLSSILRSKRAVQVNILIVRAFVQLREMLASHKDLARTIHDLERQQKEQGQQISAIFSLVKQLMDAPKRRVGFIVGETEKRAKT